MAQCYLKIIQIWRICYVNKYLGHILSYQCEYLFPATLHIYKYQLHYLSNMRYSVNIISKMGPDKIYMMMIFFLLFSQTTCTRARRK